jgi:hypothetical protein
MVFFGNAFQALSFHDQGLWLTKGGRCLVGVCIRTAVLDPGSGLPTTGFPGPARLRLWLASLQDLTDAQRIALATDTRTHLKNSLNVHGSIMHQQKMLTYSLYAPFFCFCKPCPET